MKRFLLGILALVLVGCTSSTITEAEKPQRFTSADDRLFVTQDKETGCKYIVFREISYQAGAGAGGITPLMKANGTQDCD